MLKADENPPMVWREGLRVCELEGDWRVVHTKSRNEKALAQDLILRGVQYFLPLSWKVRYHRGRKIRSLLPLFGGYMFFCGDENDRVEVLKTNRVANIIEVRDQERLIYELSQIERACLSGEEIVVEQSGIREGQRCRVLSGPLKDVEGIVIQSPKGTKLVLEINILGQAGSLVIEQDLIEVLDQ